ncbi:hypothetical protein KG088_05730 [Halomonas sp. TRM85114]|uniref:hypothetical protein n=1 Tax=Halomonas jincaotanensis TaxID=2810616 RepID=UPI001BD3CB94|nr:hypothetical protein [Halomonas jincaotanensis]MBS9403124.1 hypothetical protein [Halomonas jincaotanensis]
MNPLGRLRSGWRQRPAGERYRLLGGGLVILAMLAYLAMEHSPWRLPLPVEETTPTASPAAWESAAERLGIRDARVDTVGTNLRVTGTLQTPETFTGFADWAVNQGWWALDWSLTRQAGRLKLEARFVRSAP